MVVGIERPRRQEHVAVPGRISARDTALLNGEIQLASSASMLGEGSATAEMYVPKSRDELWLQLTHYSRWTQYFSNIVRSEVLETVAGPQPYSRLYQVGRKGFCMLTAQVEIYLKAFELRAYRTRPFLEDRIQFRFERGAFSHFVADLTLRDFHGGTALTYAVSAKPLIPVPGFLVEQGMRQDLPNNMKQMRHVLCS